LRERKGTIFRDKGLELESWRSLEKEGFRFEELGKKGNAKEEKIEKNKESKV